MLNGKKGWFPEQFVVPIEVAEDIPENNAHDDVTPVHRPSEESSETVKEAEMKSTLMSSDETRESETAEISEKPKREESGDVVSSTIDERHAENNQEHVQVEAAVEDEELNPPMKSVPTIDMEVEQFEYQRPQANFQASATDPYQSYLYNFSDIACKKNSVLDMLVKEEDKKDFLSNGGEIEMKLFGQLSALLTEIQENEKKIIPSKTQPPYQPPKDILEQFKSWIRELSRGNPPQFGIKSACALITRFAEVIRAPQKQATKEQKKLLMPSSKKNSTKNEMGGAAHLFLLEVVLDILLDNSKTGVNAFDTNVLSEVPLEIIQFCFDSLFFVHPTSVRNKAGECLGVLSHKHLEGINKKFMEVLATCYNDIDHRMYSTYQSATRYLNYGFETKEQAAATMDFLAKLKETSKKLKASALRLAISDSLLHIMGPLIKKKQKWILQQQDLVLLESIFTGYSYLLYPFQNEFESQKKKISLTVSKNGSRLGRQSSLLSDSSLSSSAIFRRE